MACAALQSHVIGPTPVECHVLVNGPDICGGDSCLELLFLFHLGLVKVLYSANADDSLYIGSILVDNIGEVNKEITYLLVGRSLSEAEPVSRSLVIYSEHHSSECAQVLCNGNKLLVGTLGVNGKGESNVLTVAAHVSHAGKRLVLKISADTALVGEIIIVGIVPLEGNICVLHDLGNSSGPLLVKGIIAVHKAYASVRSAQLLKYVILIYIFTSLGTVAKVNSTFCTAHVDIVKVFIHGYSPPIKYI